MRRKLLLFSVALFLCHIAAAQLAGTLQPGPNPVGFRTIDFYPSVEGTFRVCIWYPATQSGTFMQLSDYVETAMINGTADKAQLNRDFKSTLELIFDESPIQQQQLNEALKTKTWATKDATMKAGKWPVVICDTEPVSLVATLEYLASHGFVVITPAVQYGPPPSDDAWYTAPTRGLEMTLQYVMRQSYADLENISAFGFGGGAMASFYTGMRSDKLKAFVNVEGGLFMPQSNVTISKDYAPEKFKTPLLHIIRPDIRKGESDAEFNAIHSKKYRLTNNVPGMVHHDFTTYGRVINGLLHQRGSDAASVTDAFTKLHEVMLAFLKTRKPDMKAMASEPLFKLEEF